MTELCSTWYLTTNGLKLVSTWIERFGKAKAHELATMVVGLTAKLKWLVAGL